MSNKKLDFWKILSGFFKKIWAYWLSCSDLSAHLPKDFDPDLIIYLYPDFVKRSAQITNSDI